MTSQQRGVYDGTLISALIIGVLPFLVFWPVTFGQQIWATGDFAAYHYPLFVINTDQWRRGVLPLWNAYMFGGTPLAAAQQGSVFYPFNVFCWFFLSPWRALGVVILLHVALTGLGTFLFLHSLRLHALSALLGGLVFAWGGFTMSHLGHIVILRALPWIGFSLYGFNRWIDSQKRRYLLCISLAAAFLFLSGYPQTIVYSVSLVATYFLFAREAQTRPLVLGLIALGLGFGLSAIQVVPGVELWLTHQYLRPGEGFYPAAMAYSFHPAYLVTLLFPRARTGTFAEMVAYIGIVPLFLTILGMAKDYEGQHLRTTRFFFVWILIALALAFGRFAPPLAKLVFHIPAYGSFGVPSKHLLEFSFCAAVLSAYGLDGLIRARSFRRLRRRELGFLGFMSGAVMVLALLAPFAEDVPPLSWSSSFQGTIQPVLIIALGVLLIGAALRSQRQYRLMSGILLVILAAVDLLAFGPSIYAGSLTSPDFYQAAPKTAEIIRQRTEKLSPFRMIAFEASGVMHERGLAKELLATNYNAAYKIESLLGHDGLMLQRLHAEFDGAIPPWGDVKPDVLEQQKFRSLLNLYGVRYLLVKSSEAALLSKYYQLLYSGDEVSLFENGQARPRLFPITAPQEIEAATAPSFVGEERGWGSPLEPPSPPATVELRSYDDAHLGADVTFGRDGILVHGTNYVSGWHAKIDEVPTPVFRVAGSLQGISVPQGQHHVEFWYAPESVKWGAIVSVVAGGLVVLLCLWPRGQKTQDFSVSVGDG